MLIVGNHYLLADARRFTVLNHTINYFPKTRSSISSFTIERYSIYPINKRLELFFPKLILIAWGIIRKSVIFLIYLITIYIILIRIQQRWVYFVRYFTHSYTSICNHLL